MASDAISLESLLFEALKSVSGAKPSWEALSLRTSLLNLRKTNEGEPETFAREMKKLGFPLLGEGETRTVFGIDEKTVVKLSKSLWKHKQNQREVSLFHCIEENGYLPWFSKVLDYDAEKFFWIVSERLMPLNAHQVAVHTTRLLGSAAVSFLKERGYGAINPASILVMFSDGDPRLEYLMQLSEWFYGFVKAVEHCNIPIDDLSANNFGLRLHSSYNSEGDLVVLDYGD